MALLRWRFWNNKAGLGIIKIYPGEKMTKIHSYVDILYRTVVWCSQPVQSYRRSLQFYEPTFQGELEYFISTSQSTRVATCLPWNDMSQLLQYLLDLTINDDINKVSFIG